MFKHYFELVENIAVAPIFSLVMFFVFFLGVGIWVFYMDNNFIDKMKAIKNSLLALYQT